MERPTGYFLEWMLAHPCRHSEVSAKEYSSESESEEKARSLDITRDAAHSHFMDSTQSPNAGVVTYLMSCIDSTQVQSTCTLLPACSQAISISGGVRGGEDYRDCLDCEGMPRDSYLS